MKHYRKIELIRFLSLAFVTALVWIGVHDRWSRDSWSQPLSYSGDAQFMLAFIKAAEEGDFMPFGVNLIKRLGAPFDGNWNDFPMYEKPAICALGLLASWCGLFAASNAAVMLGHVLSALSFYFCCRVLRYRWEYAWLGALLFAFTYYNNFRGLAHVFLAYSHTVPLAILGSWLIFSSHRLGGKHFHRWLCLGIAFLMGISNPYNLSMYLQLHLLGLATHWLVWRRRENLRVGMAALAVAAMGFLLANFGTFYVRLTAGPNPAALVRYYNQTERFGLKPIELIIPPADHRIAALAKVGELYKKNALVTGEMFSPYLGWLGLGGMAWMLGEALVRIVRRDRRPVHGAALQTVWIICYSAVGSMNSLLALGGFALLRASNRYSIFISALILLFLVSRASLLARALPRQSAWLLAGLCLGLGLFDQLPKAASVIERDKVARTIAADLDFFWKLERSLPPHAMVFQLPVMGFPEVAGIHELDVYEHCRAYLSTKLLRFSYGSNKGREREVWQALVEDMSVREMVRTLEAYGFSAILLNRKGYADGAEGLIRQLALSGRTNRLEDALREHICIQLLPVPEPQLPPVAPVLQPEYIFGWSAVEFGDYGRRRIAYGKASLSLSNGSRTPMSVRIRCVVVGSLCNVSIGTDVETAWRKDLGLKEVVPVEFSLILKPGKNHLYFRARPPGENDDLSTIGVINLEVEPLPGGSK